MNQEDLIGFLLTFSASIWFTYCGYISWKEPDKIREMGRMSGSSKGWSDWVESKMYLWMARIMFPIFVPIALLGLITQLLILLEPIFNR